MAHRSVPSHVSPRARATTPSGQYTRASISLAILLGLVGCQPPPSELENPFLGIEACLELPPDQEEACLEGFIAEYALAAGLDTRGLLATMETARAESRAVNSACHPIAHAIGRYTFQESGEVGDSFNACDQSCHSGCFHGVMERLFSDYVPGGHVSVDDLRAIVPTICIEDNFEDPSPAEIFQCLHGLGHAVLYTVDYELALGLGICDTLTDYKEEQICATGVVMENITAFDKEKRDIDPGRPLYPCDSITETYRGTCYRMQTSLMLEYGLSLMEIEEQCLLAGAHSVNCFASLGRDYSAFFLRGDFEDSLAACQEYSTGYEDTCIAGLVVALIDNSWDARFAYPYCHLLEPGYRPDCYRSCNYHLSAMYGVSNEEIAAQCDEYAAADRDICIANLPR